MMEHGRYTDLEEYIRQGEPDKKEKRVMGSFRSGIN